LIQSVGEIEEKRLRQKIEDFSLSCLAYLLQYKLFDLHDLGYVGQQVV
jgi:hypothetical protein